MIVDKMGEPDLTDSREINSEINLISIAESATTTRRVKPTKFIDCLYVCWHCKYIDIEGLPVIIARSEDVS